MTASKAAAALAGMALTLVMAWPVIVAPSARIFGTEIDGRHYDAYTVMWQFANTAPPFPYRQPLVDDAGRLLARATGPVAAFNAIVLISFPLTVLTAFALARRLRLSNGAATIAALAFAFAPPHLAQAAYHPHIAQTQWLPLYFLALWAAVERFSLGRAALLLLAGAALVLSNIYSAYIAAILTPIALAGALFARRDAGRARNAALTLTALAAVAAVVILAVRTMTPSVFSQASTFAFPRADVARYGAQWFAYFIPPVDHPLWGELSSRLWSDRGMTGALVEQQVSVSWALLALAAIAIARWWRARAEGELDHGRVDAVAAVPMLATVAVAAFVSSLAPAPTISGLSQLLPASWLHAVAPMFRAYARFAFVTHLMIAILAGIGAMLLWKRRRLTTALLIGIAAVEYAPLPARAHDVLPTSAHRWLAGRPRTRILDCVQPTSAEALVPWLMGQSLSTLSAALPSCDAPDLPEQAAARGFRYVIVRKTAVPPRPADPALVLALSSGDADLYDVVGGDTGIAVSAMEGFSRLERDATGSWRWMGTSGAWTIRNHGQAPVAVTLSLVLASFDAPRRLDVSLDGGESRVLDVSTAVETHRLGPWTLAPGTHRLTFTALEPAAEAPGRDPRRLSVMFRGWAWSR